MESLIVSFFALLFGLNLIGIDLFAIFTGGA